MLQSLKINKITPFSLCPRRPVGANRGSGSMRRNRYKCTTLSKKDVKKQWMLKIKNTLYHMETLNTLVQFGQVVAMVAVLV